MYLVEYVFIEVNLMCAQRHQFHSNRLRKSKIAVDERHRLEALHALSPYAHRQLVLTTATAIKLLDRICPCGRLHSAEFLRACLPWGIESFGYVPARMTILNFSVGNLIRIVSFRKHDNRAASCSALSKLKLTSSVNSIGTHNQEWLSLDGTQLQQIENLVHLPNDKQLGKLMLAGLPELSRNPELSEVPIVWKSFQIRNENWIQLNQRVLYGALVARLVCDWNVEEKRLGKVLEFRDKTDLDKRFHALEFWIDNEHHYGIVCGINFRDVVKLGDQIDQLHSLDSNSVIDLFSLKENLNPFKLVNHMLLGACYRVVNKNQKIGAIRMFDYLEF